MDTGGDKNKISSTIYGNDYSPIITQINSLTGSTGISASIVDGNKIRLQGSVEKLHLSDLVVSDYDPSKSFIGVIKDTSSSTVVEKIAENRLQNGTISTKINDIFLIVKKIRELNNEIPIILMGYYNSIFNLGIDYFTTKCSETGIDGLS